MEYRIQYIGSIDYRIQHRPPCLSWSRRPLCDGVNIINPAWNYHHIRSILDPGMEWLPHPVDPGFQHGMTTTSGRSWIPTWNDHHIRSILDSCMRRPPHPVDLWFRHGMNTTSGRSWIPAWNEHHIRSILDSCMSRPPHPVDAGVAIRMLVAVVSIVRCHEVTMQPILVWPLCIWWISRMVSKMYS